MTIPEAISQLDSLIANSRSLHYSAGDIWERDIEALNMAKVALEKSLGDAEWISVKERLPEPDGMVLVIVSGKPRKNIELDCAYELAEYYDSTGWILEEYPDWIGAEITHWMPLPEPPQSQK